LHQEYVQKKYLVAKGAAKPLGFVARTKPITLPRFTSDFQGGEKNGCVDKILSIWNGQRFQSQHKNYNTTTPIMQGQRQTNISYGPDNQPAHQKEGHTRV
jgi:hypothetical protein